jgi:hypothetical protein
VNGTKYVALDVHTATISVAVLNFDGKLIMESVIEAKRSTIVQFIQGLRGELFLTSPETRGPCSCLRFFRLRGLR